MMDILSEIKGYIQAIDSADVNYAFERKYKDIVKEIKGSPLSSEEMNNFLAVHTLNEAKHHQIKNDIYKFYQKLNHLEKYNYFVEYMRISDEINNLKNPSKEMQDFLSDSNKTRIRQILYAPKIQATVEQIKQSIEEFHKRLRVLSCEYDFKTNFDRICRMINQLGAVDEQMLEFQQLDIRQITIAQHIRNNIPRKFSSAKYIPKKHWEERLSNIGFSKQLLRYKDYASYPNNMENVNAFNEINKIMFAKLKEIILQIRKVYGNEFNIILCACPSSSPEKINTVRLSISEFVKTDQSVRDCSDLLVRTQPIEPAHLSSDRSIDKHKNSIAINTKYGPEFFSRKNIFILCDDIYTTGNTINACKQYLLPKQTIANSIFIYTIADTEYFPAAQTNAVTEDK